MNDRSLRVLEFHKIIAMLTEHATSDPGRELCKNLRPSVVKDTIEKSSSETEDALGRILRAGTPSFGNNRDFSNLRAALMADSCLSQVELLQLAKFLENTARCKDYDRKNETNENSIDSLSPYFEKLEPLTPLSTEIRRCILSEEEIADDASPTLRKIRSEMARTQDRIHDQLISMVNGSLRTYLQDSVITQRDGRYCIPVKAEYKGQVPGMVHDHSASGSTFFIEPNAVVELNNKLRELETEEIDEIAVILAGLSAQAAEHVHEITQNAWAMTQLDFIFARGALGLEMNGTKPIFNEDGFVHLRKARHPLIDKNQVVPIDITLGGDFDLLIITGPNTGGKTVSLKTVGLFTLMGQAGLMIPALDRSELAIFREVYADIGDEQSIEQSLSTFSSHMTNIVQILKAADEHSLCLFDELGAGTDPTEGAALAISVLDHLHHQGIRTMATTHYSELKVYALSTDHVENACCEFDVETLRPTYRLLIGVPGKSNAFAISKRLGLPDYIIDAAKAQMTESEESFEDLIASLQESKLTIQKEEEEIKTYKAEIESLKNELATKNQKLDESKEKMLAAAREEARDILQEAKDFADETIKVFRNAGPGATMRDLEKERTKLHGKISEQNSKISIGNKKNLPEGTGLKPNEVNLGDKVRIVSIGLTGTVNSRPDAKGNLFVQCGIIRTQTNLKDLLLVQEETVSGAGTESIRKHRSGAGKIRVSKSMSVSTEINLLGMTADEAIAQLDKYLDDAYLAHLPSVRIVHGKGTGVLRKAVQQHLKRVRYVESFRLGEFGEGDSGVTIAVFKEK